jgi:hypothetical protein
VDEDEDERRMDLAQMDRFDGGDFHPDSPHYTPRPPRPTPRASQRFAGPAHHTPRGSRRQEPEW